MKNLNTVNIKCFDREFFARYEAIGGMEIIEKSLFTALNKLLDSDINIAEMMNNHKTCIAKKKAA